jgi:hypothetical protein
MRLRNLIFVIAAGIPFPACAQLPFLSIGVKGGGSLTDAFSDRTVMGIDTSTHYFAGARDYIVGPTAELRLPFHLAVEMDALYRQMNLTIANTIFPSTTSTTSWSTHAWEFPILAKYRFPLPIVKPFFAIGPSFRDVRKFPADTPHLSGSGFTFGAGIGVKALGVELGPELRYTRWGADSNPGINLISPVSNRNQLEFLVGLTF